jgi:hypothetical protein
MTSEAPSGPKCLGKVRFKKTLNQDDYSCQEIINHLTQKVGVRQETEKTCEEPPAYRFHRREIHLMSDSLLGATLGLEPISSPYVQNSSRAYRLDPWGWEGSFCIGPVWCPSSPRTSALRQRGPHLPLHCWIPEPTSVPDT